MQVSKWLKDRGLRSTKARRSILELMSKVDSPIDAAEVGRRVNQGDSSVDLATVYRSLEKMVEAGIVRQVDFREGKMRYEIEGEHHHHLVCEKCHDVEAVSCGWLENVEKKINKKYKFSVSEHALEFFGVCRRCNEGNI